MRRLVGAGTGRPCEGLGHVPGIGCLSIPRSTLCVEPLAGRPGTQVYIGCRISYIGSRLSYIGSRISSIGFRIRCRLASRRSSQSGGEDKAPTPVGDNTGGIPGFISEIGWRTGKPAVDARRG
ncbi:hypothetical protein [Kibdelosporangium philippinense]|uniref:hypothetical protein n=1 Tax=Kibdelosporangium philippinense TaxID=211113 RepID=UPI003621FD93